MAAVSQAARANLLLLAFNFKVRRFKELPQPLLAYRISTSPSKPLRPRGRMAGKPPRNILYPFYVIFAIVL